MRLKNPKQIQLFETSALPEPTFTRSEWDEIQRFRLARLVESGECIPSFEELQTAMRKVRAAQRG